MYSLESIHNIEILVFSNPVFSLEVLMDDHEAPAQFIKISLTTHEVILAIAVWERCFGFMIRPQIAETHASFKKLAPGSWAVALQGSRQNILKLLHTTGFEVIRFLVADINSNIQPPDESYFGYSVRVPLTRIACKMDIFMKEMDPSQQHLLLGSGNEIQFENQCPVEIYPTIGDQYAAQLPDIEHVNGMVENVENQRGHVVSLPLSFGASSHPHNQENLNSNQASTIPDTYSNWGRVPLRTMDGLSHTNENLNAYANENSIQVTETVRLSKGEVSAIIGPQGKRITMIRNSTQCRISVLPVTLETMNSRFRTQDFPQTISLTGKPQQVAQAKTMLRRALLEFRSN